MSAQEPEDVKLLKEILKWTKFAGMNQLQRVLEATLDSAEKRLAYHISDGTNGVVKVSEVSKVGSTFKVQSLWKEWRGKGLGDTVAVKGGDRFKRAFDLEEFGIEVPPIPQLALPAKPPSVETAKTDPMPANVPGAVERNVTEQDRKEAEL